MGKDSLLQSAKTSCFAGNWWSDGAFLPERGNFLKCKLLFHDHNLRTDFIALCKLFAQARDCSNSDNPILMKTAPENKKISLYKNKLTCAHGNVIRRLKNYPCCIWECHGYLGCFQTISVSSGCQQRNSHSLSTVKSVLSGHFRGLL